MNPTLPAKLALLALLLPTLALAKSTDRNQPMTIDSAAQSGNMLDDNGKIRYSGNVVIVQGTLEIHADTADLFRVNGEIDRVVLNGKQATLKQQLDDGSPMDAVADNIDYKVGTDTVVLTGNYRMTSPKGTNAGQRMVYNTKTGDMQGGGDGTRVRTVIQPKNPTPAGAPAAGAKPAAGKPAAAKPAATAPATTTPAKPKQGGQ